MRQVVESRTGETHIVQDLSPVFERQISRDDDTFAFVGIGDHVEEQLRIRLAGRT